MAVAEGFEPYSTFPLNTGNRPLAAKLHDCN